MKSIWHSSDEAYLSQLQSSSLPQSLLIEGPVGSGIRQFALELAAGHEYELVAPTNKEGQLDLAGSIRIEQIRQLYLSTRHVFTKPHLVLIDHADTMTGVAQNAFLKLLEEPVKNVSFILLAHTTSRLLPTILSRLQRYTLHSLSHEQSMTLLNDYNIQDERRRTQLLFLAEGRPAELVRLMQDETYFQREVTFMTDGRIFLQGAIYEKLILAHQYRERREDALKLLEAAEAIAMRTLAAKPQPALIEQLDRFVTSFTKIQAGGNIRLQLARSVV